jgi:TolB-like protein/Flp pilus assembly protein TadD
VTTASGAQAGAATRLHQSASRQPRIIIFVSLIVVALSAAAFYLFRVSTKTIPPVPFRTMAVLPFKPMVLESRDEAFEMGMADTLIVRLSNLREVAVRPISSVRKFSGLEQDPVAAGRELGVESVLDGQIQRWGDRIRITARLIGVGDGNQLWADQFDQKFTDIFTVQDLIAEKVTSALALKLTGEEQRQLAKRYTNNAEAYQLYLSGRFHWEKRTAEALKKAIEYFEEAIEKDGNYALAYAGLADSYALLGVFHLPPKETFPKAKEATLKALRIDDSLAEAHAALGHIKVQYDYDWAGAEREYKRAIELNPNYANAHLFYSIYLAITGRFDEGLAEIRRAQELEPSSLFIHANVGALLSRARRYDEAINQLKRVLEMNPNFDHARTFLGYAYLGKGMYEQAIAETQNLKPPYNDTGVSGQAYALSGRRSEALKEIDRIRRLSKQSPVAAYSLALIYASLGDKNNALEWLEKAYEDRSTLLVGIRDDPQLDNLRSEPRFQAIIKRMGLG